MTTLTQSLISDSAELTLVAPVDGVVVPLEDVPDAVFAEKMLGDGVAIDPIGTTVVAPCSGTIVQLHRAKHAFTIKTEGGVAVLVHVGLDTVNLKGKGFEVRAAEGDVVSVGQTLIEFELDEIARGATSALTEVVVTEGGEEFSFKKLQGLVKAGSDTIVRVVSEPAAQSHRREASEQVAVGSASEVMSGMVTITNPHGIHARPAARLVDVAKKYKAAVVVVAGERRAKATSTFELMNLDLGKGDQIRLSANGPDADEALVALEKAIASGLGEDPNSAEGEKERKKLEPTEDGVIGGVGASPGIAIGHVKVRTLVLPEFAQQASDRERELRRLDAGLSVARAGLVEEQQAFKKKGEAEKAQIFSAHVELVDEESLKTETVALIHEGRSAAQGWQETIQARVDKLMALKSARLRERADDMKDIGHRVLYAILGKERPVLELTRDSVLVCDDLTPSTVAALSADSIGGIVTGGGGATSHAAIIARSMGVPYVAAVGESQGELGDGRLVVIDGSEGSVRVDPDDLSLATAKQRLAAQRASEEAALAQASQPAVTRDGYKMEIAANIGNAKDALSAVEKGCDGVGLLRSEFLFMKRREAPSEAQQRAEYEAIGRTLGSNRSFVIRTLDVGGDKPLAYLPQPEEENPFLGIRGVRLSLKHPKLFRVQLRAALAAARHTKLNLMFPMIAQYDEFLRAKDITREEMEKAGVSSNVAIGVMIEVPSAALNSRWLAKEVDFFSVGTNDLTQYTLAMDRGHPELSGQADAFDPAVLRLIRMTVESAHAEGKWVGVCGGLAAEALATPLLVGMELDELSVPSPDIPQLKDRVRSLNHRDCCAVAEGALALPTAEAVRTMLKNYMTEQQKEAN